MSDEEDREDGDGGGAGISVADARRIVLRHLRAIVLFTLLCAAIAAVVAVSLPNRFEATATVQIDPRNKKIVNIEGVLSDIKTDTPSLESEVEIIKSRAIALRVIDQLKLRQDREFNGISALRAMLIRIGLLAEIEEPKAQPHQAPSREAGERSRSQSLWSIALGQPFGLGEPSRDDVAIAFESRLKVQRVRNSLLIEIKYTSTQSVKAARVANAIAEAYIRSQIEAKTRATEVASDLLDDRLKGLREKVAEAERNVEQFKASNNMFDADGQPLDGKQLQREMEALIAARNLTSERRAKYEQARRMMLDGESHDSLADVLQNNSIRLMREEYVKAVRREAELATKYGPKHPEMQKVVADVAKAQAELNAEIGKVIRSLKTDLQIAAEKEKQQEARIEQLKEQIAGSKDKQWKLRELEREAFAIKQLYEAILSRNKQTEETVDMQLPDARFVTKADVPMSPSSPKRKLIVLGGAFGGLALSVLIAFALEMLSGGLMRAQDVERHLKTRMLAALPLIGSEPGAKPKDALTLTRYMIAAPQSDFSESIRTLRRELDGLARSPGPRVMLVTSSQGGEGTSISAANLALYYSLTRNRTLLIDADTRRRKLTHAFGVEHRPGLLDILLRSAPVEAAILKDSTTGMHFMPAWSGDTPGNLSVEALSDHKLERLLLLLRQHYDVIVIDGPPVLPAIDARLIADAADHIVLAARWRSTQVGVLRAALRGLGPAQHKTAGVLLTFVDPEFHASEVGAYSASEPPAAPLMLPRRVA